MIDRRSIRFVAPWLLAALAFGCGGGDSDDFMNERLAMLEKLVPVSGTVKVGGKPLAGVVLTFLPKEWVSSVGETDSEGRFELQTAGRPGALPGDYKVTLSYLVAADGRILALGSRGGAAADPALSTAKEMLPPSAASFEKTTLTAVVPAEGVSDLVFDVDVQIDPPAPKSGDGPADVKAVEAPPSEPDKPAEAPKN